MRNYRRDAEDAIRNHLGAVVVSPTWLLEALDALEPFAAMWRDGDEDAVKRAEILLRRGVASEADFITSHHIRAAGRAFRAAMGPDA